MQTTSTEIERKASEAAANRAHLIAYYIKKIALGQKIKQPYRPPLKHAVLFPAGRVIGG